CIQRRVQKSTKHRTGLKFQRPSNLYSGIIKPALTQEDFCQSQSCGRIATVQSERLLEVVLGQVDIAFARGTAPKKVMRFRQGTVQGDVLCQRDFCMFGLSREKLQFSQQNVS